MSLVTIVAVILTFRLNQPDLYQQVLKMHEIKQQVRREMGKWFCVCVCSSGRRAAVRGRWAKVDTQVSLPLTLSTIRMPCNTIASVLFKQQPKDCESNAGQVL